MFISLRYLPTYLLPDGKGRHCPTKNRQDQRARALSTRIILPVLALTVQRELSALAISQPIFLLRHIFSKQDKYKMNHHATSDDINVLAPPSSLNQRTCSNSSSIAHNNGSIQVRQHRPRLTSHKAIMRHHSHSTDLDCKEKEVQKDVQANQNLATDSNRALFDETACNLLFTPPGGSSYLPGTTPRSVGLDIDATPGVSSPSPRQVASTPPGLHRTHTTPLSTRRTNTRYLCIDDVFARPSPPCNRIRPFRLQMKRTVTPLSG